MRQSARGRLCSVFLLLWATYAYADFTGKVVAVSDGDTITVLRGSEQVKVRLAEIYAKRQGLSEEAISVAHSIKIEALRQIGMMLKDAPKAKGEIRRGTKMEPRENDAPTLKECWLYPVAGRGKRAKAWLVV